MTPELFEPRTHKTMVRLNDAELNMLRECAARSGESSSALIRHLVLMYARDTWEPEGVGATAQSPECIAVSNDLQRIRGDLGRIGNNINQIAHAANASGYTRDADGFNRIYRELHQAIEEARSVWQSLRR